MKKFYLASDHAGFALKEELKDHLAKQGYQTVDLGPETDTKPESYALQGFRLGNAVAADKGSYGVAVCGTGIGISIAVNKIHSIRGARITSVEDAHLTKLHNDANVIVFGGRQTKPELAFAMIDKFNETEFEGGRHIERVNQLSEEDKHKSCC